MEISYFNQKLDNINDICNNILNTLYDNFLMLKFEKGFIKAENMKGYIENNIVKFYLEYNFYVFKKDEINKMQKLFI